MVNEQKHLTPGRREVKIKNKNQFSNEIKSYVASSNSNVRFQFARSQHENDRENERRQEQKTIASSVYDHRSLNNRFSNVKFGDNAVICMQNDSFIRFRQQVI